ncbi:hypothetical protein QCA50_020855 [Cerrena zonata]|uniref:Uncharacterized protein n=1 Tax=Cerrena zonata TaxID=2478898 RepID=A0AAW0F8I2_9APHY
MISVCPDSSNYLLKTYVTLAATEEAILNSLAAWGAAKRDGADSESRNYYRNKAREIIEEKYINNPNLDKYGFYVLLAYYLIDSGLEVFLGDTNKWDIMSSVSLRFVYWNMESILIKVVFRAFIYLWVKYSMEV